MTPPMTFDALPYAILRSILACLDWRERVEISCADVKRAVLSFCVWERSPVAGGWGSRRHIDEGSDDWRGAPIYRFLGQRDINAERRRNGGRDLKTILASYPRSGNSFLRRLLEEATGIVTGSDTRQDRTLSRSLSVFGLQGEGVVDERVRVVKTHFPERKGFRAFEGKRVVLLVRNPFDAMDSYFNMALTNTHDQRCYNLHDCVYSEFEKLWDGMVRNEIKVWKRFYLYWMSSGVPVHLIRFEDLFSRPEDCIREAVAFIHEMSVTEVDEIYGNGIRRAPVVVMTRRKAACSYRPRISGGVGRSLGKRFSKGQVAYCVREAGSHLRIFGYDPESQGFPPATGVDLPPLKPLLLGSMASGYSAIDSGVDACSGVANTEASNGTDQAGRTVTTTPTLITVNDRTASPLVRDEGDVFGRAMTTLRRTHTARDTRPLPLRGENEKAERWCRKRREEAEARAGAVVR